ncbi:DUF975 family protein [Bombilactobacillus bombi]|uniref:DUF975 family protein n=1 Tax=Bombilactobacillus bombi TaxID=1303590 RepID=UPI0015E5DCCA|nr:DUF975 family protein [Bombilactobacillus bombi]MBA1393481.1 DUF975 family protein [Lactobacillus sp. XV13L]MBA1433738.1 DUF975 family protein [Bombilactobacillus bombi]
MQERLKTRAELKREVKNLYHGQWITAIKLNLIPIILAIIMRMVLILAGIGIVALFSYFSSAKMGGSTNYNYGARSGGSLIWSLVVVLINMSIMFTTIDWLRTKEHPDKLMQGAFSVFSKRYFLGALVIEILTYIFVFLWSLLLIIPGIVKQYSYSQASYIFKDLTDQNPNSDISYFDCITRSRQLMKGQKWRLFVLQLSFLGWEILNLIVLGFGSIWLKPYENATYAAFYKDLSANLTLE